MVTQPKTQFALAGDVNIAYQVIGDGPVDLVWAYGLGSNLDVFWEEPSLAAFFRRLAEFSRLIIFDRRGCGLSDRGGNLTTPTLEERVEDVVAVLDAVGSEQASIFGVSEGGMLAALFASTHPDRTRSIIVYGTPARFVRDADHPWGWFDENMTLRVIERMRATWGSGEGAEEAVGIWAPSMVGDAHFADWLARYARQTVSRNAIAPLLWSGVDFDLVDVFPTVRVPAIVIHREHDALVAVSHGRRIAEEIPDARLVVLPGVDHLPFIGDSEAIAAEIQDFLVGSRGRARLRRQLVTLVFTDIVDSTRRVSELGDETWRELLAAHGRDVATHVNRSQGREVKHLGDGSLIVFDGPARAIRCALGIMETAARRGLSIRVGVHTGECEIVDDDVRGIAVHLASRIVDAADPDEILASSTVRDLVAGSGIRFGEGRTVELEGIAERRTLFPVLVQGASPETARRLANEQANVFRLDGEYWTLAYRGRLTTLRDSKGLRDLARLLAEPAREIHVLDLVSGPGGRSTTAAGDRGDVMIDETARKQYELRIRDLEQDLEEAEDLGDLGRASRAREELDVLVSHLTAAYGLGGRPRRAPDEVERARKAVTRRLRDAVARVAKVHPLLGPHLHSSVKTGVFCSYAPELDTIWEVHGP